MITNVTDNYTRSSIFIEGITVYMVNEGLTLVLNTCCFKNSLKVTSSKK
jgi:hypothetical protein